MNAFKGRLHIERARLFDEFGKAEESFKF